MPSITINVTDEEAARIQSAVGKLSGLPGPATPAQSKQFIIQGIKKMVLEVEREAHLAAHVPNPIEPQ